MVNVALHGAAGHSKGFGDFPVSKTLAAELCGPLRIGLERAGLPAYVNTIGFRYGDYGPSKLLRIPASDGVLVETLDYGPSTSPD